MSEPLESAQEKLSDFDRQPALTWEEGWALLLEVRAAQRDNVLNRGLLLQHIRSYVTSPPEERA